MKIYYIKRRYTIQLYYNSKYKKQDCTRNITKMRPYEDKAKSENDKQITESLQQSAKRTITSFLK